MESDMDWSDEGANSTENESQSLFHWKYCPKRARRPNQMVRRVINNQALTDFLKITCVKTNTPILLAKLELLSV